MLLCLLITSIYLLMAAIFIRCINPVAKYLLDIDNFITDDINTKNVLKVAFWPVILTAFLFIFIFGIYLIITVISTQSFVNFFNWIAFGKLKDFKFTLNPKNIKF